MKILLTPIGSSGDVHPFVGLGLALKARGHGVTAVVNGHFETLVRRAGFDYVELGSDQEYLRAIANPDIWHPRRGFGAIAGMCSQLIRPLYDIIAARHEPGQTIVVASSLALGARIAQEKLGLPLATVHLSPALFRSRIDPPTMPVGPPGRTPRWLRSLIIWLGDVAFVDRLLGPPVNRVRAELGLTTPARRLFDAWWNSPQLVLGLFPDWFARPQPDWLPQIRLTGFPLFDESGLTPLPPGVTEFLARGDKPIVFTPGSANRHARAFFEAAVGACRHLNRRGILLTRFSEQVPSSLPEGVAHFDFVPLSQLLPRAGAIVHHGGIGTTAQGLAADIPQLLTPMGHDQPDNAVRVARLGVGESLSPRRLGAASAAAALGRLLESQSVARACRQTAARFQGVDAIGGACRLIEGLAGAPQHV